MSLIQLIPLRRLNDDRGSLFFAEAKKDIPFSIMRAYWISGTPSDVERGFHAHKELQQVAVAVAGSCEIELDDGKSKETVVLDSPDKGLFIGSGTWRVIRNFSEDCVLLVFADQLYDEEDYIRDFDNFLKICLK